MAVLSRVVDVNDVTWVPVSFRVDPGVAEPAAGAPDVPHRHAPDRIGGAHPQARPGEAVEDNAQLW